MRIVGKFVSSLFDNINNTSSNRCGKISAENDSISLKGRRIEIINTPYKEFSSGIHYKHKGCAMSKKSITKMIP